MNALRRLVEKWNGRSARGEGAGVNSNRNGEKANVKKNSTIDNNNRISESYVCKICGQNFNNTEKLQNHKRGHNNGLGFDHFTTGPGIGGIGPGGF